MGAGADDNNHHHVEPETKPAPRKRDKREQEKEREAAEYLQRIETESRKLRSDLQSSRASEQELRLQVSKILFLHFFVGIIFLHINLLIVKNIGC